MRAQRRTSSSAAQRKRKTFKRKYTGRSTAAAVSTPTVTTRARTARNNAAAPTTVAAAAAGTSRTSPQQQLTGATTRSRATTGGSSSSSSAPPVPSGHAGGRQPSAAAAAGGRSRSNNTAAAGTGSSSKSGSSKDEKTVSCDICLDDVSSSNMYRLGCRHSFCRGCLASHLKSRLQDRQLPAACPAAGCRRAVSQSNAGLLLAGSPRLCKKFLEATKEASAIARGAAIYCPNSSCSKLVKVTRLTAAAARGLSAGQKAAKEQQLARVQCSHCSHDCCTSCRCSWHAGLSCTAYQALPASEKGESDLALFQLSSNKHWRRCPSCRAMVERTDGCNYMMCRCGEPFCYACGASINTCYNSGCVAGMAAAGW